MPDKHEHASEMDESEEVFYFVFPSSHDTSIILQPGEDAFHLPSSSISSQRTAILGLLFAIAPIGRDHLDAVRAHLRVERV